MAKKSGGKSCSSAVQQPSQAPGNDRLPAAHRKPPTLNGDLLKNIHVPLVLVDKNLQIQSFTPDIEPLLHLHPADQGRPLTDLQAAAIPHLQELLLAALAGQPGQSLELQDPAGCWYSLRVLPHRDRGNSIDGAIAFLIDVNDLKLARDFAESVVRAVPEPLLVLDAALRVRTANQAFYRLFHLSSRDTEGRKIFEVAEGQWNLPRLQTWLEGVLSGTTAVENLEVEQIYADLGVKTLVLHARAIPRDHGESMLLIAIDDITELHRFTVNLRRTNEDLKQFIYAASHDLREPIRTIMTYSELLVRRYGDKLGAEGGTYINYAVEAAERLEALIAGLREFWQSSEHDAQSRTPIDCNLVLQAALLNLTEAVTASGAVVTSGPLPSVLASGAPLVQLFQNLIGNALKYRAAEPPRIHVSAVREHSEWLFSLQDNGLGIDPKYAADVFGVFKRLHPRGKYPGVGIGLAICQKIVDRYGGRIWVEPNSGPGSNFKFTIPDAPTQA